LNWLTDLKIGQYGGCMRTALIVLMGFALWGLCLGVGKMIGAREAMGAATAIFCGVWFVAAGVNMWMGVTKAGYSLREELPIFLAIFLLPAIVAVVVKWKFL
jgi:uncharacterized membrane protein YidH (DUF202 family)